MVEAVLPQWLESKTLDSSHGFGHAASLKPEEDRNSLFLLPKQEHTSRVLLLRDAGIDPSIIPNTIADGIITDCSDVKVGVVTADCAPILITGITHQNRRFAGAIHAGWRGAVGGVIEDAAKATKDLDAKSWNAVVGPCAGLDSYEVSEEFRERVCTLRPQAESFFKKGEKGHHFFDLPGWCVFLLKEVGATSAEALGYNTIVDERFFSYRRASIAGKEEKRRLVSWIKCPKS